MAQYPGIYDPENASPLCFNTKATRTATGLDMQAAVVAVHKALQDRPAQPSRRPPPPR